MTTDDTVSKSAKVLRASVSLETSATESFGVMGGMSYNIWGEVTTEDKVSSTDTVKTTESISETSDNTLWSLGMFYQVEKLRVDASYSKGFLYAGPYFISGDDKGGNQPLFGKLSVTYKI